ncbi:hypothetical protein F4779DRAFT_614782 [Xylariaceae sp. FL0662B]|nr:hypothetical protein F4779DRAFT_614782 [Xylariaceae sp. FL0662B]
MKVFAILPFVAATAVVAQTAYSGTGAAASSSFSYSANATRTSTFTYGSGSATATPFGPTTTFDTSSSSSTPETGAAVTQGATGMLALVGAAAVYLLDQAKPDQTEPG